MKARYYAIFLIILSLAVWFISCGDNGTEPDDNDNDTTQISLVVDFWTPEDGAVEVSLGATLYVRICDTADVPVGVNPESVFFYLNDSSVTFATINNSCGAIDLRHTHIIPFDFNRLIKASIEVQDNEGRWLRDSITFRTKLPWDTTEYSIDTLSALNGFAVRSRPSGSYTDQATYFSNPLSGTSFVMPGGAPYSVSFTPGRSFVINDLDANIWAYNPERGIQTQLTFHSSQEKYPALSPNGHTLAFSREGNIVLHSLADASEIILASTAQGGRDFAFSMDSLYLAYRSGSGSMNPKIFIWDLETRTDIAHPLLYNEVDCFDWSPTSSSIAVVSNENLYYWRVGSGFPSLLFASTNIKHVQFASDYIYFVDGTPSGDILKRVLPTGGSAETVFDLVSENSTIDAFGINNSNEIVYAKNRGGTYTIEYFKIGLGTTHTVSTTLGQVRQIAWY